MNNNIPTSTIIFILLFAFSGIAIIVLVVALRKICKRCSGALAVAANQSREWEDIFHSLYNLVVVLDKKGKIVKANRPFAQLFDLEAADCIDKSWHDLIPSVPFPLNKDENNVSADDSNTIDIFDVDLNRYFRVAITPYLDESGHDVGNVYILVETTERMIIERELDAYREHLEDLVEDRTLALTDTNKKLESENNERRLIEDAYASRLGYEEALAYCSHELMADNPGALHKALSYLLSVAKIDMVFIYESGEEKEPVKQMQLLVDSSSAGVPSLHDFEKLATLNFEDGLGRWQEQLQIGSPVYGSLDDFPESERQLFKPVGIKSILISPFGVRNFWSGIIGFASVVDSKKWGDDDLYLADTIATMIGTYFERRMAAFDLQKAKDSAEESSRLKSEFLSSVSHEIRTPLNCIIGFSEAIVGSESLIESKTQADTILRESENLLALINDILDHAKIEAGKMDFEHHPFDLNLLVRNLYSMLKAQVQDKGLLFLLDIAEDVPAYIVGDSLRVRQVLVNLLSNSIKFTHEGSIAITVQLLEQKNDKSARLHFEVVDTGIGISAIKQRTIFESFTQADGSTTRKYGGTGLGTYIAKELVERMGGYIGIKSEEGKGTTFWFDLTVEIATLEQTEALSVYRDAEVDNLGSLSAKVLLAEDYPPNQEVAKMHLEGLGLDVTVVENGKLACEACVEHKYDLILMDILMPEMDGHSASDWIRKDASSLNQDTLIVAMTASADASTRKACADVGMNDVITKPIRRNEFIRQIRHLLSTEGVELGVSTSSVATTVAPSPQAEVAFDYDVAMMEFGNNKMVFEMAMNQFINCMDSQLKSLWESMAIGDCEQVRAETHKIKGGAGNLTLMKLSQLAAEIEEHAKNSNLEPVVPLIERMDESFKAIKVMWDDIQKVKNV